MKSTIGFHAGSSAGSTQKFFLLRKVSRVLVAAADGAIMAGPVGATPPMLDGGEWPCLDRNWFQERSCGCGAAKGDRSSRASCACLESYKAPLRTRVGIALMRGVEETKNWLGKK